MTLAFDLDGTLISVEQKQTGLLRAIAFQHGLKLDLSAIWALKREGSSTKDALLSEGVSDELCSLISARWVAAVETPYWMSLDTVLENVRDCLARAASAHDLALVTARRNDFLLHQQMRQLDLRRYFAAVYRVDPRGAVDQKAQVLERISATQFFGDSETDFQASQKAGVPFIGVSTGQRSASFLAHAGVTRVSSSLTDAMSEIR